MVQLPLTLSNTPPKRRRGRPPGAKNRRSLDLAKYIEAQFGGMTPGQQSAAVALITPRDLKAAGGSVLEAMAAKAERLAKALGCNKLDAWVLMAKERMELLAYVHQKQPTAEPLKAGQLPTMFVVSERDIAQAHLGAPVDQDDLDLLEDFRTPGGEVGPAKSDDAL